MHMYVNIQAYMFQNLHDMYEYIGIYYICNKYLLTETYLSVDSEILFKTYLH